MSLSHRDPDCTGRWDSVWVSTFLYWHCERCGAGLPHSELIAEAALQENNHGTTLRQLADAGQKILEAQGREW